MGRTLDIVWSGGRVEGDDADGFSVTATVAPVTPSGRRDVCLAIRYDGAEPLVASVRFRVELPASAPPWWLLPGLFYGENRPAASARIFPRFAVGGDLALMESDAWEFRADRAATPAVFAWTADGGVAVTTSESTALGITGVGFAYASELAEIHLRFPFAEAPVTYYGSALPRPASVASYTWQPGATVELELAVFELAADRHGYADVLREEHQRRSVGAPLNPWVDVPTAADLAAEGLLRWHYAEPGVLLETVGFDREVTGSDGRPVDRQAMHVGWVSGTPWAYALLAHGRRVGAAADVAAATDVLDFICRELSPSGTFWGVWYRDRGWSQSWSPVARSLHSRTLGEATLFVLRALALEPGREPWSTAARSNLDVVVARQRADGNLGSAHHAETGAVLSWEGCAGLAWMHALAEAEAFDADGRYLAAAERAGEYYTRFVLDEYLHGAPEDVDLAPTSEDGYVALMGYLALYRRTGSSQWLDIARRAADWLLTFRYSYNVEFPAGTMLQVYGFASR